MTQQNRILRIILTNPRKKYWGTRDFQRGKFFIGYEAGARLSELVNKYEFIKSIRDGKYRYVYVDWKYQKEIMEVLDEITNR